MLPRQALSALHAARSRTLCRALGLPARIAPSLRSLSTTGRLFEPQDAYTAAQSNTGGNSSESLLATLNKIKRTSPGVKTKEGPGAAFTAPESPRDVPSSSVSSAPTSAPATSSSSSSSSSAPPASSAPSTTSEVQSTTESTTSTDKFSNLKGKINGALYKALTQRPFNFEKMSSVQEAVLNLLPELAVEAPKNREGGEEAQAINKARQDLLVKAKTGTGKTIAFLVPALEARFNDIEQERQRFMGEHPNADKGEITRHMNRYTKDTVGTVILSPTRELASQIATEAIKLMTHIRGMDVRLFIGGASKHIQLRDFERYGRDIIVATPGRMKDMLTVPMVRQQVEKAKVLVLDEADTLLDMGFKDDIDQIVSSMPPKGERQTFLFSATVSPEIKKIARSTLRKDHTFIDCVPENESNTHAHIPQYHSVLPSSKQQFVHIARLLAQDALLHPQGGKAIIFLPTTKMTELTALLIKAIRPSLPWGIRGTRIFEMHSKKNQSARDRTADQFRSSNGPGYDILVTSDVSARGVDYPGVTRVIQVGVPGSKDTYVHRVGRTGRAGKSGRGDLVLLPWEENYLHSTLQEIPLQPIDIDSVQSDIEKLAADLDANPPKTAAPPPARPTRSRFDRRDSYAPPSASLQHPILPRIQALEERLTNEVIPEISELDASEAFASQLGFYVGRSPELGMQRSEIYEALQEWAVEALGLATPPTVSPKMVQMLGLGKSNRGGKMRGFGYNDSRRRGYEDLRSFRNDGPRNPFRPFQRDRDSYSAGGGDRGGYRAGPPAFRGDSRSGGAPRFRTNDRRDKPSRTRVPY